VLTLPGIDAHVAPESVLTFARNPCSAWSGALNLPTSAVITGIDSLKILDQALEAARTFKPMSKETLKRLLARTATAAATGRYELFKTDSRFDGTARNSQWLG
jgi:ABC-type branched-subunit amino acid transport system substrate-binding protein